MVVAVVVEVLVVGFKNAPVVRIFVWLVAVFPEQDTGSLQGGLRADQSISFQDMQTKLTQIVRIIKRDPAIQNVVAFTGGARAGGGFLFATMKPKSQRDSARDVINRLRPKLSRVTGVAAFLSPVQDMRIGGRGGNSSYQYTLMADDPAVLAKAGPALADALKRYPELTDVDVDEDDSGAEVYVNVDRDTATRLVTPGPSLPCRSSPTRRRRDRPRARHRP